MRGAVAIVTGGGTGIGAAVVRRLAARGVRCVINYAHSRDEAEALERLHAWPAGPLPAGHGLGRRTGLGLAEGQSIVGDGHWSGHGCRGFP